MLLQILLQILLNGLVSSFYLPITMMVSKGEEHFLDFELFIECDKVRVVELLAIVCDYGVWEPRTYR